MWGLSPESALKIIAEKRDVIQRAAAYYDVDPVGIGSVIFQEKYHGVFAEAKDLAAYIIDGGVNDSTPASRSYGLAEMQLARAAELIGADVSEKGVKEKLYEELMNDDRSIAYIALNISKNEEYLGRSLIGSEAGYAHNMGAKRYQDFLNGCENPPST